MTENMGRTSIFIAGFVFSITSAFGQVPVREEPRHKVALENEYIRLLDVRLPPGDTSLFHIHEIPSFFIPLSTTAIGSQVQGQEPKESRFAADSTWYNGFENGPLVHRVWNSDTSLLHVIDLELLSPKNSVLPDVLALASFKIAFENNKLRVYKFKLSLNQRISIPALRTPALFISVTGPAMMITEPVKNLTYTVQPGGFQWLEPQQKFDISNKERVEVNAILILLK